MDARDGRDTGLLLARVTVVIRGNGAHILPSSYRASLANVARRWARDDIRLSHRRFFGIDFASGHVILPTSDISWRNVQSAVRTDRILQDAPAYDEPSGCFSIASWTTHPLTSHLPSRVIGAAGCFLNRSGQDGRRFTNGLVELLAQAPPLLERWDSLDQLRECLLQSPWP
jgi:hypothetical protein